MPNQWPCGIKKMKIKKYSLPYSQKDVEYVRHHVTNVLKKGYLTDGGEYVGRFESEWAKIINADYSIAVNSCTTALEIILKCIGVDKASVVVPTYTFFATPLAAHLAGAKVIYADISKETLSLSLDSIKEVVQEDTRAVIVVHVGGIISNEIISIRNWCDTRGIYLIEDAACAHGASYKGISAGNFGHYAAFSFHHSKILTCGEGGMIITKNKDSAIKIRKMRAIGLDRKINNWEVFEIGNNYKMPELSAILGLLHCNKSHEIFEERRKIARFYDENIKFNNNIARLFIDIESVSGYYKYVIMAKSQEYKKDFIKTLREKYEIDLPPTIYEYLCHEQKINNKINQAAASKFDNARHLMKHNICLPMYCGLKESELCYIVNSINEASC